MSGKENERARAWQEWADTVRVATNKLCSSGALRRAQPKEGYSFVGLSEHDSHLPEIAYWLADQVMLARANQELSGEYRYDDQQLSAMRAVVGRTRSAVYAEPNAAIWLAARRVEYFAAALFKKLVPEVSDDELASVLTADLATKVHPKFVALESKQADVLSLLRRYEPGRSLRTKAGQIGKLGANGILSLLNELSGRPLGEGGELTANAIAIAIKRAKARVIADPLLGG